MVIIRISVGPAPSPVIIRNADVSVRGDLTDGQEYPSSVPGEKFKTGIVAIKEVPPRSGGPGGRLQRPCNSSSVRASVENARHVPTIAYQTRNKRG